MNIAPADLFLMRLNALTNIAVKFTDALWWGALAMLIASVALWVSGIAAMKAADVTMRVWRWCRELTIAQTIALFVVGLAMAAYFAGVYARAMKH